MVQVRTALPADLPALRRLFRRSSLSNEGDRELMIAHPELVEPSEEAVAEGRTRVAVSVDGAILGFATGRRLEPGVLELEDLFVDPDWMRRGIGRTLLADFVALAERQGIARIEVTANPHADAFYRSVGFVRVGETETQFGPAARMELRAGLPRG
ncbi:MAG: GNAT family N-acetyltransferase [Solirubrobacteraceae bacterium]